MLWGLRRRALSPLIFGMAWFFAAMLPRCLVPSQELACDYKTYIASFGMMLLIAAMIMFGIQKIAERFISEKRRSLFQISCFAGIAIFFMVSVYVQNKVWRTEKSFWANVVRHAPKKGRPWNNLAVAYLSENDLPRAIENFERAIASDGKYSEPHVNLAYIYQAQRDWKRAGNHYDCALAIGDMHPQLFYNLGNFYLVQGNLPAAEESFKTALKNRTCYPQAFEALAELLFNQGRLQEARNVCEEAVKGLPGRTSKLLGTYGRVLFGLHEPVKAKEILLGVDDGSFNGYFILGCCFYDEKEFDRAIHYFEQAYRLDRHDVALAYNFGQALMKRQRFSEALEVFGRCNNVVGEMPYVELFKAECLCNLGRHEEAKERLGCLLKNVSHEGLRNEARTLLKNL